MIGALIGSAVLMALVLLVRAPARRAVGPELAYTLWALPVIRLVLPPIPFALFGVAAPMIGTDGPMRVLATSIGDAPAGSDWAQRIDWLPMLTSAIMLLWATGAVIVLARAVIGYRRFRRTMIAEGTPVAREGAISIIAADVTGPMAFGMVDRYVAVPRDFAQKYDEGERALALAHEFSHHWRGDLIANWIALIVLAIHWFNPLAWIAYRGFRSDQEFAVDARVLRLFGGASSRSYAQVIARASGIDRASACNLNSPSELKRRLTMIANQPVARGRTIAGAGAWALLSSVALAASATAAGQPHTATPHQATTIVVKPDGKGDYGLIVGGTPAGHGAALPAGLALPADFTATQSCDLKPGAVPTAILLKGEAGVETYSVLCASAAAASTRNTLAEGLASLTKLRESVATQPASTAFPEPERAHALGAIDRSIREIEGELAKS